VRVADAKMNNFQKGLDNIVAETRRELSANRVEAASVSSRVVGSALDGAQLIVVARGKCATATFKRQDIDDCHHGVTVGVQVEIKRLVSEFER